MTLPNSQIQETFYNLVAEPTKRFHTFFDHYCNVNVNLATPVHSYVRSGKEIIRMANVYFGEHDYFHAFVLYSRFLILFLEKIKTHSQFSTCDKTELAAINKQLKTTAFPRAEKLKKYIKDIFEAEAKEYTRIRDEESKRQVNTENPTAPPLPDPLSGAELEALKSKYNLENEQELRLLQEKELNSLKNATNDDPPPARTVSPPLVDRNLKPKTAGNIYNFRTINVPSDLAQKFLDLAQANTSRNIETCGILAGKLNQNTFTLSHCIIPKQSGSSDTCTTEQEHELFDTIDQQNLITLGWIHTHPSQTAFLSSIDLHTQFGYQIMIPEAIAIVCAPSFNENRTFILTPNYGIKEIADCSKSGFHPHSTNPPLFEECDHIKEDPRLKTQMIDLRIVTTNRVY